MQDVDSSQRLEDFNEDAEDDYNLADFVLEEGEEKRFIDKQGLRHPSVIELKEVSKIVYY